MPYHDITMTARTFFIGVLVAAAAAALAASAVAFAVELISGAVGAGSGPSMMADHMAGGMASHMGAGQPASTQPTVTAQGAQVTIRMVNNSFQPANLEVTAGTTVTWLNEDAAPHTATAKDHAWDSGIFNRGQSWSHTFDQPGTYDYYCVVHPGMTGIVRVTD